MQGQADSGCKKAGNQTCLLYHLRKEVSRASDSINMTRLGGADPVDKAPCIAIQRQNSQHRTLSQSGMCAGDLLTIFTTQEILRALLRQ